MHRCGLICPPGERAGPPDAAPEVHGERGYEHRAHDHGVEQHAERDNELDLRQHY